MHWKRTRLTLAFSLAGLMIAPLVAFGLDSLIVANIRVSAVSDKTATIEWTTNIASRGEVEFGLSSAYGSRYGFSGEPRVSHAVTISNLQPETTYHFRVRSNTSEQEATSFDQTFKTTKAVDRDTPVVTDVGIPYQTANSVTIQWRTTEASDSQVLYGQTTSYGAQRIDGARVTVHDVTITGLQPLTTYHFQVKSRDAAGNTGISADYTFRTTSSGTTPPPLELVSIRPVSINDPGITENSAEVSWRTTVLADGVVRWGTTSGLGLTVQAPLPRDFFHAVKLVNLQPATTYYFQVESKDVFGKSVRSPVMTFVTRGGFTPTPQFGSGQVLGVSSGYDLTFYASFDRGLDADFALGDNTAGIFGVPHITSGKQGRRGEALNASNGSKISFSGINNFFIGEGTVAFWFKPRRSLLDNHTMMFFDLNPELKRPNGLGFRIAKYGHLNPTDYPAPLQGYLELSNNLVLSLHDQNHVFYHRFIPGSRLPQESWQFVAATWMYDGGNFYLYSNGSRQRVPAKRNATTQESILGPVVSSLGDRFYLGSADALIDELAIFGRVLSDEEIQVLYAKGVSPYLPQRPARQPETPPTGKVLGASTLQYTPANALLRAEGQPDVYAIMSGQKHLISGPNSFAAYGYRWSQVRTVKPEVLKKIPDARLVRTPDNRQIFFLYQRPQRLWLKLGIPSPTVFISYRNNFWGNVITINEIDMANYPDVRLIKSDDDTYPYFLEDGKKRAILNDAAFDALGLPRSHVATVNRVHLDFYPNGEEISAPLVASTVTERNPQTNAE